MTLIKQVFATMVLAALLGGAWYAAENTGTTAHSKERKGKRSGATLVLVEAAASAEERETIRVIGTGEARRSIILHSATAGEVIHIGFDAGQRVKKGAVLLRLDATHQRLAVRLAEVDVKEANRQSERLEKLAPKGAASMARLETAETDLESARVRLDQARAALRDRRVIAPFEGVIGLTDIDVGDRITEDTAIATLDDRAFIEIAFDVPEKFASRLAVGNLVTVRPRTMPKASFEGAISAIGSRVDTVTRSIRVKAEIANPDDGLRPGTSFDVELSFVGGTYPSVREVAVLWSRDGAYVWRIEDDRANKLFVKIVRRDGGRILLDGPLKVGDPVVVEGVQGLRQGQRVKPEPYGAEPEKMSAKPTRPVGSTG